MIKLFPGAKGLILKVRAGYLLCPRFTEQLNIEWYKQKLRLLGILHELSGGEHARTRKSFANYFTANNNARCLVKYPIHNCRVVGA
jgi:hypothetical protein